MLRVDPQDKEKLIDPLFKTPRGFYPLAGALSLVLGYGIYCNHNAGISHGFVFYLLKQADHR